MAKSLEQFLAERPVDRGAVEAHKARVSNIEHGDLERVQIDTLRRYVEAVGGALRVEVELGDERFQIA
jgi:hypothetical protein